MEGTAIHIVKSDLSIGGCTFQGCKEDVKTVESNVSMDGCVDPSKASLIEQTRDEGVLFLEKDGYQLRLITP
jgi:hypothetical protein